MGFAIGGFFVMIGLLGLGRALIEIQKLRYWEKKTLKSCIARNHIEEDRYMYDEFGMRCEPPDDDSIYDEYGVRIYDSEEE